MEKLIQILENEIQSLNDSRERFTDPYTEGKIAGLQQAVIFAKYAE